MNTGRMMMVPDEPEKSVHVGIRQAQPLIELRAPIVLPIMELDSRAARPIPI